MKKYIAELIGTFFLVYTIGHTVIGGHPLAPIGIGLVLAAMIYACGHLSGGHFNPAVTLGLAIADGLQAQRVRLPDPDAAVLLRWSERTYGF